jgi:hypothetical protein
MRCADVNSGQISTVQLVPTGARAFTGLRPGDEVELTRADGVFTLTAREQTLSVEGGSADDDAVLERLASRRLPMLAWVLAVQPQGAATRITVQAHEFPLRFHWEAVMDIAVDEKIVDDVSRRRGNLLSVDAVCEWLTGLVVLDGAPRVLLTAGAKPVPGVTAFRLHGRSIAVDVATGPDGRLRVQKVVEARAPQGTDDRRPIVLARVQMRFVDATVAGIFRGVAKTTLDQLVAQADNYLALWRDYNGLEGKSVLRRARQLGAWKFSARRSVGGGWRFELEDPAGFRRVIPEAGLELEAAEEPPGWLSDAPDLSRKGPPNLTGAFLELRGSQLTLRVQEDDDRRPPATGWLHASLHGDLARLAAREDAWNLVASADNSMPQLAFLLLGQDVPAGRRGGIEPLSPAARACFKGEPTERQIEALRVALNTPDIAVIQGPPGTGKTQVIAALQVRLAEIAEERDGIGGLFLVTAFQHEAVENAAGRIQVLGLPAAKVGRRKGDRDMHDGFDAWREERAMELRRQIATMPQGPALVALQAARRRISAWLAAPSKRDTAESVARWVYEQLGTWLPADIRDRALSLSLGARPAAPAEDVTRELALRAARQLRTDPIGWSDDGPAMAWRARARLNDLNLLSDDESALLAEAANLESDPPEDLFRRLAALRATLVDRLLPRPSESGPARADADAEALLREVSAAVVTRIAQSADGATLAMEELHHALVHDSEGVRDAVTHYTTVLASTCGQTVGGDMRDRKGDGIHFDTVVVDEAARANPLDLLIPLSRAVRRIVLVGDHRQLAHLLEPDVEGALDGTVSNATQDALRKSLFERLFVSLREGRDPVRVVTLDKQFRMHRVLGDFVSRVFYKPHREGFDSPRPDREFSHMISRWAGKVAGWVNVPQDEGVESPGKSKSRPVEAERVADEVAAILADTAAAGLTIGVVSFYSAQVDEVMEALTGRGIATRDDADDPVITAEHRPRLRVGTVDAFQGREFDVVILSCTRSSRGRAEGDADIRRRYGHLLIENRLCVAMSRAQRLLIAVGDLAMFANGPVPGLASFAELCRGEHGLVR